MERREMRFTLEARLSFILGFPRHPSTDDQLREESLLMNVAEQDYWSPVLQRSASLSLVVKIFVIRIG
jgi:hypothetical protein